MRTRKGVSARVSSYQQRQRRKNQAQKSFRRSVAAAERRVDALLVRLRSDKMGSESLLYDRDGKVTIALADARHSLVKALRAL